MKAVFTQEHLDRALKTLSGISIKQSLTPLLTNFLIECTLDTCTVRATNLNCALEVDVTGEVSEVGSVCVDGQLLLSVVSRFPKNAKVTLDAGKGSLKVMTEGASVTLKISPTDEFPATPMPLDVFSFNLTVSQFVEMFKSVEFAASSSDIKPEIASVCLWKSQSDERLVSVATDSYRLAELRKKIDVPEGFPKLLIPSRNVVDVVKIMGNFADDEIVTCGVSEHLIKIMLPHTLLMVRHIDGAFPDYERIIPKETVSKVTCLKKDLEDILKLSAVVSSSVRKLTIHFNEEAGITIETENDEKGSVVGHVKGALEGDSYTFSINELYFMEGLQKIHSEVLVLTISPKKPLTIRALEEDGFTYLIMPMQA